MEQKTNEISALIAAHGLNILAAIAIFVIGKWLVGVLTKGAEKAFQKAKVDETLAKFLKNVLSAIGLTFVVLAVLAKLGIQTASFIAVLGAAGLAVGMALQGSLSNFAAGVMIILFRPYKAGDFIAAGGTLGTVQEIQIFNTVLSTPDNVCVILPNSHALSGNIMNYSTNSTRRVDLVIGVSYGDDILKAKKVLEGVLKSEALVLADPAPVVAVKELGESSVNFVVRPWVKASDYWTAYFGLTEKIKLELEKNGMTIPFPQRDLHLHTIPKSWEKTSAAVN